MHSDYSCSLGGEDVWSYAANHIEGFREQGDRAEVAENNLNTYIHTYIRVDREARREEEEGEREGRE